MQEQDVAERANESMETKSVRQALEVERLTGELMLAKERASASLHLTQTVVGTVHALAGQLANIASSAFEFTDSVETLVARTGRVMNELKYVQAEAETGMMDTGAAKLLSRQLRDIARTLDLQITEAEDQDIQQMRDLGQDERRDVEDRRRIREDDRRHEEDDRRETEDNDT